MVGEVATHANQSCLFAVMSDTYQHDLRVTCCVPYKALQSDEKGGLVGVVGLVGLGGLLVGGQGSRVASGAGSPQKTLGGPAATETGQRKPNKNDWGQNFGRVGQKNRKRIQKTFGDGPSLQIHAAVPG